MRYIRLFIILLGLFTTSLTFSQLSRGGTPYFLQPSVLRAASETFFIEMPPFDLDSVLREDSVNAENMRGSYRFAYKFYTNIDINNGIQTVLPDGTTVKQIGIRSAGAYSINLLLRDFEIPPGGKLFIYSADRSHVVGSFDYRNNSDDKILPVRPVAGEAITVEYSEPANVSFRGHFIISEVNHDYRDVLRMEPNPDNKPDNIKDYACMPDVLCSDAAEETVRSTVLLIIDGTYMCTGSLLNNTSDDGKPYLLTGVHCFVKDTNVAFPTDKDSYIDKVGTIIAFFNYNRPVCDANILMKGSEEMSLAGASPSVIVSRKDIALLELKDTVPDYFNVYYAGWNRDMTGSGQHTNIHHPKAAVKKYGRADGNISISSYPMPTVFDANSHWLIPGWTIGSTYGGSSGSPLFDENKLVIGGLTGGNSTCSGTSPGGQSDYFTILGLGWETGDSTNQLKTYLDPANKGVMQYPGKDPNSTNPIVRLANAQYTKGDSLITSALDSPNQGYVFGTGNQPTEEFAEAFTVTKSAEIFGVFLLIPPIVSVNPGDVTISVYTGNSSPKTKIYSTGFMPRYMNYSSTSGFIFGDKNLYSAPTETFVVFDSTITVRSKFFVSYSIKNSSDNQFCVYNTKFGNTSHPNTAWVKDAAKGWISADAYAVKPLKTSLAIQPLVRNVNNTDSVPESNGFYYDRSGGILSLFKPLEKDGQAAVYSTAGLLMENVIIPSGQTSVSLIARPKGTIGIVKITSENFTAKGKIIY